MTPRFISNDELELSSQLNAALGVINVEISLLPSSGEVDDWPSDAVLRTIVWCQDALLDALRCALQLSLLDDIDKYSRVYIAEVLVSYEMNHARLAELEEYVSCRLTCVEQTNTALEQLIGVGSAAKHFPEPSGSCCSHSVLTNRTDECGALALDRPGP